jgi:hypothetical protein
MQVDSLGSVWDFLSTQGRSLLETSLPSWQPTEIWNPETTSWPLPLVGLGLVWLLARPATRWAGCAIVGFFGACLLASVLRVYPLGRPRTDIFAFPIVIALFTMGVHLVTRWIPKREILRTTLGLAAVGFALFAPIRAEYWAVNDIRLVRRVAADARPADGLILSPAGTFLAAYYGPWPFVVTASRQRPNATQADIVRDLTAHLPPSGAPRPAVERLLVAPGPERVWYLDFRTAEGPEVLEAMADSGYAVKEVERTTRGRLYLGTHLRE